MGCCQSDSSVSYEAPKSNGSSSAFQGPGQKLGTIHEQKPLTESKTKLTIEKPLQLNPNLDDETREKMRADRAAAAEARVKKQQGSTTKKKYENTELRGPNSRNTMQWKL